MGGKAAEGEAMKKPRLGRPPRAAKSSTVRVELRLTVDERKRWVALAERQGITIAELVRESVETSIARGSSR